MAGEQQDRKVPEDEKKLASDWLAKIQAALARKPVADALKTFERNRKLLRGIDPDTGLKLRSNLHFANLASMRPQIYAKDPEYAVKPTKAVAEEQLPAMRRFAEASETVLHKMLVRDAKLKKRAKRLLTGAFATSVGWWMCSWQEPPRQALIANPIKDSTDNETRLEAQKEAAANPTAGQDSELLEAQASQTEQGMQAQAEVPVGRGVTLDFILSEDVIILDPSVLELGDYLRADAIAMRVWMTRERYRLEFGYDAVKGKSYVEQSGGAKSASASQGDKKDELLCVYQVWQQSTNRVFTVCEGEEGFCREPFSPDWTGRRWYPFFGLAFNEIDGAFYPLSDIELTEPLVKEYNEARDDLVKDRRDTRPFTVVRKGGSLTPDDTQRIRNRQGNDIILVEGVGQQPIANDIQAITLGDIKPENYNTQPARADMEMIVGGGDAQRGSVMEAKTATEAKILSQGMHGRSEERRDTMEDLLSELGEYVLQMCLRKLTREEVARVAGEKGAESWPVMRTEDIFDLVTVEVRGGSTGKPDQMLEQEQWTKLLPVIEKTAAQVGELYMKGQQEMAQVLIELLRETLRRFDERLDIEQFLPQAPEAGMPNPLATAQELAVLKQQFAECQQALKEAQDKLAKNYISAAASIATSANPQVAVMALPQALSAIQGGPINPEAVPPTMPEQALPPEMQHEQALTKIAAETETQRELGKYKADRDGQTRVAIAGINAEAQKHATNVQAESQAAMQPLMTGIALLQQQMQMFMQQAQAPKQKTSRKVVHERDPATNRLVSSRLVEEPEPQGET